MIDKSGEGEGASIVDDQDLTSLSATPSDPPEIIDDQGLTDLAATPPDLPDIADDQDLTNPGATPPDLPDIADDQDLTNLAATASDPLEIAAVLETDGVSDRVVRERHGLSDVFALAEELFLRSPHWAARPGLSAQPTNGLHGSHSPLAGTADAVPGFWLVLRGPLYAIPAFVALALLRSVDRVEGTLLIGGLTWSWAWAYAMAYLGWVMLGHRDRGGASRLLRRAMLLGIVVMTVVSMPTIYVALVTTDTMRVTVATLAILIGQAIYLLSATTILMLGGDRRLLIALLPAVAAAGLGLATLPAGSGAVQVASSKALAATSSTPNAISAAGVVVAVALVLAFALLMTRGGQVALHRLSAPIWIGAFMHAGYGLLIALLLLYPAINELINQNGDPLSLSVTLGALPLVVSMGAAELLLRRHRMNSIRLLASTASTPVFVAAVRRAAFAGLEGYVVTIGLLSAVTCSVAWYVGLADFRLITLTSDYLLLGVAIFTAMMINALGQLRIVLITLSVGVATLVVHSIEVKYAFTNTGGTAWLGGVGAALVLVHLGFIRRLVARPESLW